MHNFTKSQTRLAFIQFIFQFEFDYLQNENHIDNFQEHFYNQNISIIGEKKEFKLKFNKNFLKKLSENYLENFDKNFYTNSVNKNISSVRKFEKWNKVLKSLIFAILSELQMTEEKKIKIVINDYLNISKTLVSLKETKLINAIIQKILDEK
tara:strand:- start:2162 stop:2617 length:456 start_codon:yes stop_codon:yes gene_type:complete